MGTARQDIISTLKKTKIHMASLRIALPERDETDEAKKQLYDGLSQDLDHLSYAIHALETFPDCDKPFEKP